MLDDIHDDLPVSPTDHNSYILGSIKEHNVVIACLPNGDYGLVSANTVAMQLLSSFHSIQFSLMVGIGGGVPNSVVDIRLGDVVVSKPTGIYGGVVQYDYGKALSGGFERTGMLNRPPQILLTALSKLQITLSPWILSIILGFSIESKESGTRQKLCISEHWQGTRGH
jgi:nucleoside phosphorylase